MRAVPKHNFEPARGRRVDLRIESEALKGNWIGDPHTRSVAVVVPEGYDDSDADYPLFVGLAGYTGSGLKQLAWRSFGESLPQRLDRLVAEGAMGPVVLALPDAFTSLGGNQYVDSAAMGAWEEYLLREVIPEIESQFRVRRGAEHRAVFGKSSGGYGALVHGMRHADEWGAIASHSGDVGFELLYGRDFPLALSALAKHEGDPGRFIESLGDAPKIRGSEFHTLMVLAMAATYAPEKGAPYGVRLPVDPHTCERDEERWARWLAHDPLHMADDAACLDNLRKLKGLFIDVGDRDQYFIQYGTRALVNKLRAAGVDFVYEEFPDDHSGIDYRMDRSLPYLYEALT